MATIEAATNTAPSADREALRTAYAAQREAAFAGLEELMNLARAGMNGHEDMQRPELQNAFVGIYDAALAVGAAVQKIAETVGCEDYANPGFKPTAGADARVQKLQAAINEIDIHVKEAVGKMMSVSALVAIAVECAGASRTASNLWGTFQALHHMARDTSNILENVTA